MSDRIAHFPKDWVGKNENNPGDLRVFMLHRAFHLSPDFLYTLDPSAVMDRDKLSVELEILKEEVRNRANEWLRKKNHQPKQSLLQPYRKESKLILKTIESMNFFPSWLRIEELTR